MASEVIAGPDVEALVITWLAGKLGSGVGISTQISNPRPAKLCRVRRTGGFRNDLIADSAQLTFECWGPDEATAFDICRLARAHLEAAAGEFVDGVWVLRVTEVGGPSNFPDPESDSPRYQYTAVLTVRAEAI